MSRYAIVVSFALKEGSNEAFLDMVLENGATSVREEPDCFRFDVLTGEGTGCCSMRSMPMPQRSSATSQCPISRDSTPKAEI